MLVIDYRLGKVNVVANAVSKKSSATLAYIQTAYVPLLMDMKTLRLNLDYDGYRALLASFVVKSLLVD